MSRSDRILVAAAGGAIVLAIAAATVLLLPVERETADPQASLPIGGLPSAPNAPSAPSSGTIVVDVEGAVLQPGIRELPAGSRIADALAAAGGYAADADLDATAATINLAEPLADGQQVVVPRIGDGAPEPVPSGAPLGGGAAAGGLVDLNTATPEELEALPGIGAVTVQKIVAAREERPFASLEDAVDRGVINKGQLEDIEALATAG